MPRAVREEKEGVRDGIRARSRRCLRRQDHTSRRRQRIYIRRLRHGTKDNETSLAISVLLKVMLENNNLNVDFYFPWDRSHSGDYDLPELFEWIKAITNE